MTSISSSSSLRRWGNNNTHLSAGIVVAIVGVIALLTTTPSSTRSLWSLNTSKNKDDTSDLVQVVHDRHRHRKLAKAAVQGNLFGLFGTTPFCRRVLGTTDRIYQTVDVSNFIAFFIRNFGDDEEGECGDVCEDICNHKPCFQDYSSPDDTLCECIKVDKSACGANTTCNTKSDNCECNRGYEGNPLLPGCSDINECKFSPCGPNGQCINRDGTYECTCNNGYTFANGTCVDRNECREFVTPCGPNATCTNTVGSFTCACTNGFRGTPPVEACADINECRERAPCGEQGTCTNIPGAYQCTCNTGYNSTAPIGGCVDINECNSPNACIPASEICSNTVGSFNCLCRVGFGGTPGGNCFDINECSGSPPICGPNANCNNTAGSYTCACAPGFFTPPPNCRKLQSFEKCTRTTDCESGLTCALTSRSDVTTTSCCASFSRCNVNQDCCNGAYTEGQTCPSRVDSDCRDNLKCGQRNLIDGTFVCCRNTFIAPFTGNQVCS